MRRFIAVLAATVMVACSEGPAPTPEASVDITEDGRLAVLLAPCQRAGYYGVDLADTVPVLVEVLVRGDHEPLRRAQTELGQMGARAVPALRRLMEHYWTVPYGSYRIRNALGALSQSSTQRTEGPVHDLLLRSLEHSDEEVRMLGVRALERHGVPGDYDLVRALFDSASTGFLGQIGLVLHHLDPDRATDLYLDWIEAGAYPGLRNSLLPLVASSQRASVADRCRALLAKLPEQDLASRVWLNAPLVRHFDTDALERLRGWRVDSNQSLRERAIRALIAAGRPEEILESIHDSVPNLRLLAASVIDTQLDQGAARALLSEGAQDSSPDMQLFCLQALAQRGDPAAIERGLALLNPSNPLELDHGMRVLSAAWSQDPDLAQRVFDRLLAAYESESPDRPLGDLVQLLQSFGRVPHGDATEFLLELASSAGEVAIKGMRAHRWLSLQAGNGGPSAQQTMFDRLEHETDPLRRLDLLEAASAGGGQVARERLLTLVAGTGVSEIECLYAGSRLVRLGPARDVAWRLKRAALRMQNPRAQRALQCLLWSWYPEPAEGR